VGGTIGVACSMRSDNDSTYEMAFLSTPRMQCMLVSIRDDDVMCDLGVL
jgi:hypothetical protein